MNKLLLYFKTIRKLKSSQIVWRILYSVRKLLFRKKILPVRLFLGKIPSSFPKKLPVLSANFLLDQKFSESELLSGKLRFLNEEISYRTFIDWKDENKSKLWRYNLHYFDYLPILANYFKNSGDKSSLNRIKQLLDSWIKNNQPVRGDGWEPYPLSLRIVNWIKTILILSGNIPNEEQIFKSLCFQCSFLNKSVEYHLGGNHIVKNGKALVFGGVFFGREKWLKRGMAILEKGLKEQILNDGGHFERSPSYHGIVLEDYLDVVNILGGKKDWSEQLEKMMSFLVNMSHNDNCPALFNDSSIHGQATTNSLQNYFFKLTATKLINSSDIFNYPESGYYGEGSNQSKLIIDCGPFTAENLPAHGHCDILSLEFSYKGERMIVDSGNYDYEQSEMRNYCRSTKAHNTVAVGNYEQHELWSVFRAASLSKPNKCKVEYSDNIYSFSGSYSHYSGDYSHFRQVLYCESIFLAIKDVIKSKKELPMTAFLHFSDKTSDFTVKQDKISFVCNHQPMELKTGNNIKLKLTSEWYCPDFGVKIKKPVVEISPRKENRSEMVYLIDLGSEKCTIESNNQLKIGNKKIRFTLK